MTASDHTTLLWCMVNITELLLATNVLFMGTFQLVVETYSSTKQAC